MPHTDTHPPITLPFVDRPFHCAIFDCDGTLADTMPIHFQAWQEALAVPSAVISEELFYELGGVPTMDIVRVLNERFHYSLGVESTAHAKELRYEELLPALQPVPRVVEVVRQLHGRCPLAVCSGGLRRLVVRTLQAVGIEECFPLILAAEDAARPKPAPDLFLLAAARMGVAARDCVVFEDSDLGLEAAGRAGMQQVDVRPWVPSMRHKSSGT